MRLVPALLVLGWQLVAGPARAADEPLRLTWSAPAGCPSADEVRAATMRETGARQANDGEILEAEAQVEPTEESNAASWRVRLRTRRGTATGEREIEAATCSGVADATAVVLALALVPPVSAEEEPAAPPPAPVDRDRPPAPNASREPHAFAVGASIAGDVSTLPTATAGGSLTLAWAPLQRVRVELDARRWASQSQTLSTSDSGARFSMTSVGGRGCWVALRSGPLDIAPCAGADVHLVAASGYGADANFAATAEWTAVTGGGLGRFALASWLALRARAEAFAPLTRPTFVVQNEGPVHRPPVVGAAASFGVEVLFL